MLITLDEAKNNLRVDTADDDGLIESIMTAARKLCILFPRDNQSGEEAEGIAGSGQEKTGTEDSVMFSRRAVNNALVNKSYYYIGVRGTRSFKQLNELFAGNGMIGFVAEERVDGKLILPEAVQIMKLKVTE